MAALFVLPAIALAACSSEDGSSSSDTSDPGAGTGSVSTTEPESPDTTSDGDTSTTAGGDSESGDFLLLSYNVAGLPQEISEVNPETNIPLIAPLLEDYDIVLTQEDFDWWMPAIETLDFVNYHTRLRSKATHEYRTEKHPGPEAVGITPETDRPTLLVGDGLGMLSRYPFRDLVRVPWEGCFGGADTSDGGAADCLSMKGFSVAVLELAPGAEIVIVNHHGEAGNTPADRREHQAGFRLMAQYLNDNFANSAIVLAGDTNLHSEEGREELLDEDGNVMVNQREIWQEFMDATGIVDVCDVLTCEEPGRIDKAAFRSNDSIELVPTEHTFEVAKFSDDAGEALSDHDALAVRFTWKKS